MEALDVARKLRVFSEELVSYKLGGEFADAVSVAATILEQSEGILRAKEEDRLIVLPAKMVYEIVWVPGAGCDELCPMIIEGEPQCDMCDTGSLAVRKTLCGQHHLENIGTTVFLTQEEAEEGMEILKEEAYGTDDG